MRRIYPERNENSLPKKAKSKLLTPRNKSSQKVTRTVAQKTKGRRIQKQMLGMLDDDLKEYLGFHPAPKKQDYIDVPSKTISKETISSPNTPTKPNPSITNNPPPKTQPPLLSPRKSGLSIKNKLALGALGLGTVGAIGYTIYRKTRKDKGKKRGKYR